MYYVKYVCYNIKYATDDVLYDKIILRYTHKINKE
jgi:hypothetical protein